MRGRILFFVLALMLFVSASKADSIGRTGGIVNGEYEFIRCNDSNFYSAHLISHSGGDTKNYFLVKTTGGESYYSSVDDFIMLNRTGACFPVMNFDYPFLIFKDNASRFLHPNFAIKFLHILHRLNYKQTISDAMRRSDEQLLYLRRGWTDVESSPHMFGLAADLVYYSHSDRQLVISKADNLDMRFLEHGRKSNRHIHLQDNEIWKHVKPEFGEQDCAALNDCLKNKVIPAEKLVPVKNHDNSAGNYSHYSFANINDGVLKLVFLDKYGKPSAEIRMGVFEPGKHMIQYNTDFLKEGAYTLRIYFNYDFIEAMPVLKG